MSFILPKLSIIARLSVLFAFGSLFVFTVTSTLVYWTLDTAMQQDEAEEINNKVGLVQHLINDAGEARSVVQLRHQLDDALLGHGSLRVWLLNEAGVIVYGDSTSPILSHSKIGMTITKIKDEKGNFLQGIRKPLKDRSALGAVEGIVVISAQPRMQILQRFLIALSLISTIGIGCISVLGFAIAKHGLRPLKRVTEEVRHISGKTLSIRLDDKELDGELLLVVTSFNLALERVEYAYQQTEAFNADVAHELLTPLATLITGTELALLRQTDTAQLKEVLFENLEQLGILSSIIKDMLFLSQADRGNKARRDSVQSLATLAKDVVHYHEAAIEEAGLEIKINGDTQCSIDAALVKRALSNLVVNATRHALPRSEIHINIQGMGSNELKLEVKNTGETIDPAVLPKMFQRFFRGDRSRQNNGINHGLGLAIVDAIARMHDGQTFARSALGQTNIGMILRWEIPRPRT